MVEVHFHADIDSYDSDARVADGIIDRLPESYSMEVLSTDNEGLAIFETHITDEALEADEDNMDHIYEAFLDAFEKTLAEIYKENGDPNAEVEAGEARDEVYCWLQVIEDDD